jgi:hypothetical protein
MGEKEEDVFSDSFDKKPDTDMKGQDDQTIADDIGEQSEFTPPPKDDEPKKDSLDDDWEIPDKQETPQPSRKKAGILGAIVISAVIIAIVYASGIITIPDNVLENMKPIELGESVSNPIETPVVVPQGSGGTKDVSSATDKVEIEKTNDPIGYYMITTNGDWYGDFVDIRKIPSKIEKSGNMKINFRCFTDDFQGTSTYFGTFRNVVDNNLTVEVYINGLEVESKSTNTNKALILEGSCYGHES